MDITEINKTLTQERAVKTKPYNIEEKKSASKGNTIICSSDRGLFTDYRGSFGRKLQLNVSI
jgi:hypothetical protein